MIANITLLVILAVIIVGSWMRRLPVLLAGMALFVGWALWTGNGVAGFGGFLALIALVIWYGSRGNTGGGMGVSDDRYHGHD